MSDGLWVRVRVLGKLGISLGKDTSMRHRVVRAAESTALASRTQLEVAAVPHRPPGLLACWQMFGSANHDRHGWTARSIVHLWVWGLNNLKPDFVVIATGRDSHAHLWKCCCGTLHDSWWKYCPVKRGVGRTTRNSTCSGRPLALHCQWKVLGSRW